MVESIVYYGVSIRSTLYWRSRTQHYQLNLLLCFSLALGQSCRNGRLDKLPGPGRRFSMLGSGLGLIGANSKVQVANVRSGPMHSFGGDGTRLVKDLAQPG